MELTKSLQWCVGLIVILTITNCIASTVEQGVSGDQPNSSSVEPSTLAPEESPSLVDQTCTDLDPHPIGAEIAGTYDVAYKDVMGWFCSGHTFEDILLALQTKKLADVELEWLLDKRLQGKSWDQIWDEAGITAP